MIIYHTTVALNHLILLVLKALNYPYGLSRPFTVARLKVL
jgi:hypothetical protein